MNIKSSNEKPMEKDVCCSNIIIVVNYIDSIPKEVSYTQIFEGIVGNNEYIVIDEASGLLTPVNDEYLLDPYNWISNKCLNHFYDNVVCLINDPDCIYKAGRNVFNTIIGAKHVIMRLLDVRAIIDRLPKENAKYNRNKQIEIVKNDKGYAIIKLHWDNDQSISKYSCDMNRGVYEGLGTLTKNRFPLRRKYVVLKGEISVNFT